MNDAISTPELDEDQLVALKRTMIDQARALGFDDCRVSVADVSKDLPHLDCWLALKRHGSMDYMERHRDLRADPQLLLPGTVRAVCVRMSYLPAALLQTTDWREASWKVLHDVGRAAVSRYAHARDYHKVLRQRLQTLAEHLNAQAEMFGVAAQHRVFTDSAPVMEVALAARAGLGWRGKHTLLLDREGGSMFFLGGFYTTLPLPEDEPVEERCGTCSACLDVCPTKAIVAPYELDARRCISYLTIEHAGAIPVEFREAMGNRVYGCDDCQLVCPWNKYARFSALPDFMPRHQLDQATLLNLWSWTEADFLARTEGSAIRRIGYERWRRNLAVGLGNVLRRAQDDPALCRAVEDALRAALPEATPLVREHVEWALGADLQKSGVE
jgi:epoxyqueuosine reductase